MPNNNETPVVTRELDLSAEVRKIWGPKWNAPEVAYEFGDRKFVLRTEDAAIYITSPDFG